MANLNTCHFPPSPGPKSLIRRLKAGEKFNFILLGNLWGCWTHWAGNKSEPCTGEKQDCVGHRKGLPVRWKGYLHVVNQETRQLEFLEVTPLSADQLLEIVGRDQPLRGNRIHVRRGEGTKARLTITILAAATAINPGIVLPPGEDPSGTLRRLWGMPDIKLRQDTDEDLGLTGTDR